MIKYSGTATSFADLLSQIIPNCTANGWVWDATNSTLRNAANTCAFKLTTPGAGTTSGLVVVGGTGTTAGVLNDPQTAMPGSNAACQPAMRAIYNGATAVTFSITWKLYIYTNPDMIAIVIGHDSFHLQHMMMGLMINLGSTGKAGNVPFCFATYGNLGSNVFSSPSSYGAAGSGGFQATYPAMPGYSITNLASGPGGNFVNFYMFINEPAGFNASASAITWAPQSDTTNNYYPSAAWTIPGTARTNMERLPNIWNNDSQLVVPRVAILRQSGFYSLMAEIPHIRFFRNDNTNDGDVQTIGTDNWILFSAESKNSANPNPASTTNLGHSGTFGIAYEYTP